MRVWVCDGAALPQIFKPITIMQEYLRGISDFYPDIPKIFVDGYFGAQMSAAVLAFQQEFELPQTGRIDLATWDMIVGVWQGLERISVGGAGLNLAIPAGNVLAAVGGEADNQLVPVLQAVLADMALRFGNMPAVAQTGVYDEATGRAVQEFRRVADLPGEADELDRETWNRLLGFWGSLAG